MIFAMRSYHGVHRVQRYAVGKFWYSLLIILPHNPPLCIEKELWLGASSKAKDTSLHWEIPRGDLHTAEEQSSHLRAEVTAPVFPLEAAADADLP